MILPVRRKRANPREVFPPLKIIGLITPKAYRLSSKYEPRLGSFVLLPTWQTLVLRSLSCLLDSPNKL